MQPLNVVIATTDTRSAGQLADSLNRHFRAVSVARSLDAVRHAIPKRLAQVAIVDLELASMPQVRDLCSEFAQTQVLCTHRIPDEEMWADALNAGAIDCCQNADITAIVDAVR